MRTLAAMSDLIEREAAARIAEALITCDEERIDSGECCCCTRLAIVADQLRGEQ